MCECIPRERSLDPDELVPDYSVYSSNCVWICPLHTRRQEAFMENYFTSQRDNVFRNVEVLIYVFDVEAIMYATLLGLHMLLHSLETSRAFHTTPTQ